jgi:hypothetical protein
LGYWQDKGRPGGPVEEGTGSYGASHANESKFMKLLLTVDRKEWFAVTAFPLFAGTFGTIASALNICALVGPWRCELVDGGYNVVNYVSDPAWCVFKVKHPNYHLTQ